MESGGWSGDCPGDIGVNCLVAIHVGGSRVVWCPGDVWRERHFPDTIEDLEHIIDAAESQPVKTLIVLFDHGGSERFGSGWRADCDPGSGANALAGAEEAPPVVGVVGVAEEDFDATAADGFDAAQARAKDAGIVEDQEIT